MDIYSGAKNPAELGINCTKAAKEVEIKKFAIITTPKADEKSDIDFGRRFGILEKGVKEIGIAHIFVSLPQFVENWYWWLPTIKNEDKIYWPCSPDSKASLVSLQDDLLVCCNLELLSCSSGLHSR